MAEKPNDIEAIYNTALKKGSEAERSAYLDVVCGDDPVLRARVEALLKAHEEAGDFLEVPALEPNTTLDKPPMIEGPGTKIGRYELLELIGEGGMGLIYLAEQKKPVRRRVALKIIKPGMDTKQVIARFEAERQALALLDHPNIAHVFDAGTTKAGRPYFVMEYVRGMSITKYSDERRLNIEERLRLFEQVCEGIHHAHQKGIIHRDIKPSNILVSMHGDRAIPKIIDFGIAKAITQPLTEKTFFTHQGQLLGTPEYMSPEQVDLATQDIDTRSDIYSLGVVLYELLAGVLPFERESFERAGFAEIQQTIREQEPASPSIRLTSLGEKAKTIAASRCTQVITLARRLHRELEWIPLKAMRKDRCRRYRSASELADDVRNYLNGLPLIAGPETAMYRVRKFVHKHAGSVATVALVAIAIVLGLIVSTAMYFRAEQALEQEATARAQAQQAEKTAQEQRKLAEQHQAEAITARDEAQAARETSEQQAETLKTIVPFYDWGTSMANWGGAPRDLSLASFESILQYTASGFDEKFKGPKDLKAKAFEYFGIMFSFLGNHSLAEQYSKNALDIRREELGNEDPLTLISMNNLAGLYVEQDRFDETEALVLESLKTARKALGKDNNVTRDSINCLARLLKTLALHGIEQYRKGNYEEAFLVLSRADDLRRTMFESPTRIPEVAYMAMALYKLGREPQAYEALGRLRRLSKLSPVIYRPHEECVYEAEKLFATGNGDTSLLWEYIESGKLKEASQCLMEIRSKVSDKNDDTCDSLQSAATALARAYYLRGKDCFRRGGDIRRAMSDYKAATQLDPHFIVALNDLARLQASCPIEECCNGTEAVKAASMVCALTDWRNPGFVETLAAAYAEAGDYESAVTCQKKAMDLLPKDEQPIYFGKMQSRLMLYQSHQAYRMARPKPIVAWWKLDETEGRIAADSSGNGLDGRLVDDTQWYRGLIGGALAFDGDGDYVDCGKNPDFDITDEITVSCWFKISQFSHFCASIIAKGDSSWQLERLWTSNQIYFKCYGVNVETNDLSHIVGTVSVNDGQWHHVAGVFDGKKMYLYIDGQLDNFEFASGKIAVSATPVYIGQNPDVPEWSQYRYWNGLIDDVRIYSFALTEAEIKALYASKESGEKEK